MSEDLHKDDFEDLFRDSFEKQDGQPAKDAWDMPSDLVWDKIDQALPEEDEPEKIVYWIRYGRSGALILLLLLMSLGTYFYFVDSGNRVEQEKEINTEGPQVLKEETSAKRVDGSLQEMEQEEKPILETLKNENVLEQIKENIANEQNDEKIQNKLATARHIQEKQKAVRPAIKQNQALRTPSIPPLAASELPSVKTLEEGAPMGQLEQEENSPGLIDTITSADKIVVINTEEETIFKTLKGLPTKWQALDQAEVLPDTLSRSIIPFSDVYKKNQEEGTSVKGFYMGLMGAPAYTYRAIRVTGNPVISKLINMDEKAALAFNFGVNLGYQLNENWSVESGFSYSQLGLTHNGLKQVRYTSLGERPNTGNELEQDYSLDVGTSGGNVGTEITLARRSGTIIPENDFINLKVKAKQNINFGSVPMILRYQSGKGPLQFGLKAGLVHRFVLDGYFEVESVEVLRSGIRPILNERFYAPRKLRKIEKYELDFLIGAGLSYQFGKKVWLNVEPTFSRSINPIFKSPHFETFPVIISLDLGLNYRF